MSRIRVFIAHPKDTDWLELKEILAKLKANMTFNSFFKGEPQLITGSEDHAANFHRFGGWDGWTASVAMGKEYHEGLLVPRFDMVVVTPTPQIGKATADIVRLACSSGKPVVFFDGTAQLARITGVSRTSESFKDGWVVY